MLRWKWNCPYISSSTFIQHTLLFRCVSFKDQYRQKYRAVFQLFLAKCLWNVVEKEKVWLRGVRCKINVDIRISGNTVFAGRVCLGYNPALLVRCAWEVGVITVRLQCMDGSISAADRIMSKKQFHATRIVSTVRGQLSFSSCSAYKEIVGFWRRTRLRGCTADSINLTGQARQTQGRLRGAQSGRHWPDRVAFWVLLGKGCAVKLTVLKFL